MQEKAGEILQINRTRLASFKKGYRQLNDDFILRLAELLKLDKGETLYKAKLELDPENAHLWEFMVCSAGLEPTPQASETWLRIFKRLFKIIFIIKLSYFVQCIKVSGIVQVCIAFCAGYVSVSKQFFDRVNGYAFLNKPTGISVA